MHEQCLVKPPVPPPCRIVREGTIGRCEICGSSLKRRWFGLGSVLGCLQPKCWNWHGWSYLPVGHNRPIDLYGAPEKPQYGLHSMATDIANLPYTVTVPGDDPMRPTMFGGAPAAVVDAVADALVRRTDEQFNLPTPELHSPTPPVNPPHGSVDVSTPRTDCVARPYAQLFDDGLYVPVNFARALEREIVSLNKTSERCAHKWACSDTGWVHCTRCGEQAARPAKNVTPPGGGAS